MLGRTYTQRKEAVARGSREKGQDHGLPEQYEGNKFTLGSDGLQRRSSQRPKQKPLLDLTPMYQEPPQHRKKGHGVVPENLPVGGLVEAATNPDPIVDPLQVVGADIRKMPKLHTQHSNDRQTSASPEKHEPAFTGGLLFSVRKQGQDGLGTGQGLRTGEQTAREPLLNMTTDGPWAKGSLLDKVNSVDSGSGQTVDRAKRREVDAPVGEGLW